MLPACNGSGMLENHKNDVYFFSTDTFHHVVIWRPQYLVIDFTEAWDLHIDDYVIQVVKYKWFYHRNIQTIQWSHKILCWFCFSFFLIENSRNWFIFFGYFAIKCLGQTGLS